MSNPIGWVEIPVTDMNSAIAFYDEVFGWSLQSRPFGDLEMAMFPSDSKANGASGALVYQPQFYEPSPMSGALVYFSCPDCGDYADKSEKAGGRVLVPKQEISPEFGYMSIVLDNQGNRIGFHSMS